MLIKIIEFIAIFYVIRFVMNLFNTPSTPINNRTQAQEDPIQIKQKPTYNNTTSGDYIEYEEIK
jgi:hypothetical protein